MCVCVYTYIYIFVCVCVCERERERTTNEMHNLFSSSHKVLATGHHIHAWKMLYAAWTELNS